MKRMIHIIGTLLFVMMVWMNLSFTSHAYTEEQKQQAKAWLSAHGYSPDMGGANQAYQDYLNGKFDEELGVDVNGDGIPAATEATTDESSEDTAENSTEEVGADETEEAPNGDSVTESMDDSTMEEGASVDESTTAQEEDPSAQEKVESISEENIEEDGMDEEVNEESTLYQPEKKDAYQEAGMVIVLAVLIMLLAGLWLKKSI